MTSTQTPSRSFVARMLGAALLLGALHALGAGLANAAELIPSLALTKATDDNAGDAQVSGGLALRAGLLPFLKTEIGVSYREQSFYGDQLKLRTWPVTASLWLTPLPVLYAGGGVGWYQTTFDYSEATLIKDRTDRKFGVHLGGGLEIPIAPHFGLDLNGRYIFMTKERSELPPQEFNPDYWSTSLGLAISF